MEYYTRLDDSFPFPEEVMIRAHRVDNIAVFKYELKKLNWLYKKQKTVYDRRIFAFATLEFINMNIDLCYNDKSTEEYALKIADGSLERNPHLYPYFHNFKMRCVKTFYENAKQQARKNLTTFYMNHCEGLCFDVVENIMKFY